MRSVAVRPPPTHLRGTTMRHLATLALLAGTLAAASACSAQQQNFVAVGTEAPDIVVTGATRSGVMSEPVHLSDFRGQTVVLAFFFRARTPG